MNRKLYVMLCETNLVKIGVSKCPEKRKSQFESNSGYKVVKQYETGLCSNALDLEKKAHEHFSSCRTTSEWFDVPFDVATEYIKTLYEKENVMFKEEKHYERKNLITASELKKKGFYQGEILISNLKRLSPEQLESIANLVACYLGEPIKNEKVSVKNVPISESHIDVIRLKTEIYKKFGTIANFANHFGVTKSWLHRKFKREDTWTTSDILKTQELLGLSNKEAIDIFFNTTVSN